MIFWRFVCPHPSKFCYECLGTPLATSLLRPLYPGQNLNSVSLFLLRAFSLRLPSPPPSTTLMVTELMGFQTAFEQASYARVRNESELGARDRSISGLKMFAFPQSLHFPRPLAPHLCSGLFNSLAVNALMRSQRTADKIQGLWTVYEKVYLG